MMWTEILRFAQNDRKGSFPFVIPGEVCGAKNLMPLGIVFTAVLGKRNKSSVPYG